MNAAESDDSKRGRLRCGSASTGPPRERGGEDDTLERVVTLPAKLQRGRRVNAAESECFIGYPDEDGIKLQRGRRVNAAESSMWPGVSRMPHGASTGPPRERGGELLRIA